MSTVVALWTRRAPYRGKRCAVPRCGGAASWDVHVAGLRLPACGAHAALARRERGRFLTLITPPGGLFGRRLANGHMVPSKARASGKYATSDDNPTPDRRLTP